TVINPKALPEFFAVTAATNHFQKISWQKEQESDRPEQVINETDHWIADCGLRKQAAPQLRRISSVEPYARASFQKELRPAASPKRKSHPSPIIEATLCLSAIFP